MERQAARAAIIDPMLGDQDEAVNEICGPEIEARDQFAETTPTTVQGLLAMIAYAGEIYDNDADSFDRDSPIFTNMATAARALTGGRS